MNGHSIEARPPYGRADDVERITDMDALAAVLQDAAHVPGGRSPLLAVPHSEAGVAAVLRGASGVLPVGAQSSLTGGATPRGDVVLSTRRFERLEPVGAGLVRVGAGVTLAALDVHLSERGAFYPPAPTYTGATLGGTIATNAAGAATFKYGTTRAWVEALTVVLSDGWVLDLERGHTTAHPDGFFEVRRGAASTRVALPSYRMPDMPKLSAGYFARPGMDLVDLFIGAEGTLGVIVDAVVRVQPVRPALCHAFTTLRNRGSAMALVAQLRRAAQETWRSGGGLDVSAIEHMDARSLSLVREDGVPARLGLTVDPEASIGLLMTLDLPVGTTAAATYDAFGGDSGGDPSLRAALGLFASLLEQHGALERTVIAAPGDADAAGRLLALREAVPVAVNRRVGLAQRTVDPRIEKTAADTVVPFERFESMLDIYEREFEARGLDGAIWGHISDGNVHPNVLPRSYADVLAGREAILTFGREAIRLGGAPLAEHGVGRNPTKQRLLVELYGERGVGEMRAVKRALDPSWKLAPGVIFTPD